jgi:hypothetical protein
MGIRLHIPPIGGPIVFAGHGYVSSAGFPNPHLLGVLCPATFLMISFHQLDTVFQCAHSEMGTGGKTPIAFSLKNMSSQKIEQKSLLKVFTANKLVGKVNPTILVASDSTTSSDLFAEHFIITGLEKPTYLIRATHYSAEYGSRVVTLNDFPEVFSAEAMLASELELAKAHFENVVQETSKPLHSGLYLEGRAFEFREADTSVLFRWKMMGQYKTELTKLFEFARSKSITELENRMRGLPRIKVETVKEQD